MTMRSISAAFDSRAHAESARQLLAGMGVAADKIHILEQRARNERADSHSRTRVRLWKQLKRMLLPEVNRKAHEQSIQRSVFVLTVSVVATLVAAVVVALESSNAIELDEHEKQWRKNVWRGSATTSAAIDEHRRSAATPSARPPGMP